MSVTGEQGTTGTADMDPSTRLPLLADVLKRSHPFDLPPGLAALAARGPVHRVLMRVGEPIWLVCGYAEARSVLSDPRFSSDRFSRVDTAQLTEEQRRFVGDEESRAGAFLHTDPPTHTRYRRLLNGQFTMRRMRQLSGSIEKVVTERLDAMLAGGSPADLVTEFAEPIPSLIICELLGTPYADRATFEAWTATALRTDASIDEMHEASERLREYTRELVRRKRIEPADDLISDLVHNRDTDPPFTDVEVTNMVNQLLVGGHETTENMFALGMFALLQNPWQLDALRRDPSLVDDAVEELLRYITIVRLGMFRVTTEDVELSGTDIPEGSLVLISPMAANRDVGHWIGPAALDLARADGPHLAFGHGAHQCIGAQLARVQLTIGFTQLLRRLPNLRLAVPAEEVPFRDESRAIYGVHSLPIAWDAP